MAPIDEAIEYLESLRPGEEFSYTEVAHKYGVVRSTLSRRHRGVTRAYGTHYEDLQNLNHLEEAELVAYIQDLSARHLPPTRQMIQNFASTIAKKQVSESWVTRFINRNSIHLISQWATGMDQSRHAADSADKYKLYFSLLHHKINEYHIEACHTYNMDEKGFMIGVTGRSKQVFSKTIWESKMVRESLQDGLRDWVTLIACVCADGTALPPSLIFASANSGLQSSWVDAVKVSQHEVYISSSPSGWSNNQLGLAWVKGIFDRETKEKAGSKHRLLILDGHGSHVTMDFLRYCDSTKILLCVLPPHSTQTLQPLDVALFKPLSTAYSKELSNHLHKAQGQLSVKKGDFFSLFWRAWVSSFIPATVLSSFRATGISPMDPNVILKRFVNTSTEASPQPESSSDISAEDWRRIDRLVRSAVKDQSSRDVRKIRGSIHHIAVQNELLRDEISGLQEALQFKDRHNKKSKPLDLQQSNGGTVFYSPKKLAEAEEREAIKERNKEQEELKKVEMKELREANRLYKEKIAEEKREQRERAKVVRAQEKEMKAAEQARKKTERDAQKALQLSQKGKRKASQGPSTKNKRRKPLGGCTASLDADTYTSAAPTVITRRGRNINLPAKFK